MHQIKNKNHEMGLTEGQGFKNNQQYYAQAGDGDADMMLLNPMDINEPIEGILISEEEKRIAPIL